MNAPEPPLLRIVYLSTAMESYTPQSLQAFSDDICTRNRATNITGAMAFNGGNFLQVIEGPAYVVDDLFEKISADPRHAFIDVLQRDIVEQRIFADYGLELCSFGDTPAASQQEFRTIREFLNHCPGMTPDLITRGLMGFFIERVGRIRAA